MARTRFNVLNRLKIWQKLTLVALAFSIPLGMTTYFLLDEKSIKIDFAQWELHGDEYLRPTGKLLSHLSRYRSLQHRLLAGDAAAGDALTDLQGAVDRDFRELELIDRKLSAPLETTLDRLEARQRGAALPSSLRARWEATKAGAGKNGDEQLAKLISDVRTLITHVGDTSKLILDPDLDTYYTMDALLLREPEVVDRVGQLIVRIEDIAHKPTLTAADKADLAAELALLQYHVDGLAQDAATAVNETANFSRYSALEKATAESLAEVISSNRALTQLVRRSLIEADVPPSSIADHHAVANRAITANLAYWSTLLNQEDVMLNLRMSRDLDRRGFALYSVLAVLALTGLLTVFILRSITQPIAKAAGVARQLARGELPDQVEVGSASDETAMLLASINDMLRFLDLKHTIETLKQSAQLLTSAMVSLEEQVVRQDEEAMRQSAALQETQVTTQEIKQTSKLAAEKAALVLQVAERAEGISKSGESAIEKSIGGMQDIRAQAEEIVRKVSELAERTQQISVITQTVKDLADQSNMLALNAAIEAVRSGEHGKGFSVVAREIRSLADQSIQATNRVNEILESISSSIRTAVAIGETGLGRIESGIHEVRGSGDNLRQLSDIVQESSQSARQIAAAVSQQDAGITEIFRAVSDQAGLMELAVNRVEGIRKAVGTVKEAANAVSSLAGRFQV